jgi:xylan 1,4-beta-xylosidase
VQLVITGLPGKRAMLTHYRIDSAHSNSYEVWKKMGSPQQPTAAQVAELEKAGQLQMMEKPRRIKISKGETRINMEMPRQAVSLLQLTW